MTDMNLPKVSCLCPTFARVHLLEEAIESFLRQEYQGEKELIVLNDFTMQELQCDAPDVVIKNAAERLPTLGDKRNATAKLASGDLLLTWGDDDIHLPHRITRMVEAYQRNDAPMVMEGSHYCLYSGIITLHQHATAGAHIVSRQAYWDCGGIPSVNCGEDRDFNLRLKSHFGLKRLPSADALPAFLYRFSGTQRTHISALGDDAVGRKSGYQIMLEHALRWVHEKKEPSGTIRLTPCWREEYQELVKSAVVKK